MIERWNRDDSGVLHKDTLFLRAGKAGEYGISVQYGTGSIYHAYFTYLCGLPDAELFEDRPDLFCGKSLVCMTEEWARFLRKQPNLETVCLRRLMKPLRGKSVKEVSPLPSEYRLRPFDEEAFARKPYQHGSFYQSYEDFSRRGSGFVIWHGKDIVCSVSSHLSLGENVELDVTTSEAHRRRGLADRCVAEMLNDCAERKLTVHWDAKNTPSMRMAQSHGFELFQEYAVYCLKA